MSKQDSEELQGRDTREDQNPGKSVCHLGSFLPWLAFASSEEATENEMCFWQV